MAKGKKPEETLWTPHAEPVPAGKENPFRVMEARDRAREKLAVKVHLCRDLEVLVPRESIVLLDADL